MFVIGLVQVPVLSGQTVEDKVQDLSQQVAQMSALILELRSEVARSREETRELRLELRRLRDPGESGGSASSGENEERPLTLAETRLEPPKQEVSASNEPNASPE